MAHGYKLLDHATGHVYETILAKRGREPRPSLDRDPIGAMLQGLVKGLGLRYKIDPSAVPQSSELDPGLYASAVAALLAVVTRPVGDGAD